MSQNYVARPPKVRHRSAGGALTQRRRKVRRTRRLAFEFLEQRRLLAVMTVNGTADSNARDAILTLREAILLNNRTLTVAELTTSEQGQVSGTPTDADRDTIAFNIPTSDPGRDAATGVFTLEPATALPTITDPVIIDGYTQPGAAVNTNPVEDAGGIGQGLNTVLRIEIDGSAAGVRGFEIAAGDSTLRGLTINRFSGAGIFLRSSGNRVAGNFIGTSAAGDAGLANGAEGVRIQDGSDNTVGGSSPEARNLISGNSSAGVSIFSFGDVVTGNVVLGNLIGTDKTGTTVLENAGDGVHLENVFGPVTDNIVGGTTTGARNVITGNNNGVAIVGAGAADNLVQGNFIGTDVTGTTSLTNPRVGETASNATGVNLIRAQNNTIGGTAPGTGNVISASRDDGVLMVLGADGNRVLGNFIGTNRAGTAAIANTRGMRVSTSNGNVIGTPEAGAGNLISGNSGAGVVLEGASANNTVQGNRIGTGAEGTGPLANGGEGVLIDVSANANNVVGGTDADDGTADGIVKAANVIAFNGRAGVAVVRSGTGNRILGNSIFSNGQLGIDLGIFSPDGVTVNDADDSDAGPNNGQNFPVITSVTIAAASITIEGMLSSTPDRDYRIELFATTSDAGCHSGQSFLGFVELHTGPDGESPTFTFTASGDFRGQIVTATATDLTTHDTSEFSRASECPDLIVTTTADEVDPSDGLTSLREAITAAGNDFFFPGADTITFRISADDPGHVYYRDDGISGQVSQALVATTTETDDSDIGDIDPDWPHSWWSLRPDSALPFLNTNLTIDGYSQPGSSLNTLSIGTNAVLRIELDGSGVANGSGLTVLFATATIQGLVINRFPGSGIELAVSSNNVMVGNFIGTDPSGSLALGNQGAGVQMSAGIGNIVGGAAPEARNLISANRQSGVGLFGDTTGFVGLTNNHQIVGNLIGTDRDGVRPLGNAQSGVLLASGFRPVNDNRIEGNTIAFNAQDGVLIATGGVGAEGQLLGNHILTNSIFANGGLGILIAGAHVNDPGDADTGPNNRQNFPVLTEIASTAVQSIVFGTLNSNPRTQFLIQFFASEEADPSGHGEGKTFLGETVVVTDSAGDVAFGAEVPVVIPESAQVTATATRLVDNDSDPATPATPTDTSEFSRVISGGTSVLQLGETIERDLALGQELRFRLTVPPGTDARLSAEFLNPQLGELFINVGRVPDVNTFTAHVVGFADPKPEFLLPGSAVPYFITLRGTSTAAVPSARIVLSAELLGLEIIQVSPNHGSNAGQVTTTIVGAGLSDDTVFSLVAPDGTERPAAAAIAQNDTTFFVTFDLVGLAPDTYDLRAADASGAAVVDDAFTVTAGALGDFRARLVLPSVIRGFGEATLVVEYANVGETDIAAPLVIIASNQAKLTAPLVFPPLVASRGGTSTGGGGGAGFVFMLGPLPAPAPIAPTPIVQFLAISENGPAGVLPPGAQGRFEFRIQDDGSLSPDFHPSLDFELIVADQPDKTFDLASSKERLRPALVDPEAWEILFSNLLARLGGTVGSYTQALADAATYLSTFGIYTGDIDRLLALHLAQADGALPGQSPAVALDAVAPAVGLQLLWGRTFAPTISRRFDLGILGRGWSHPWDLRLTRDAETSDVAIRSPLGTRRFHLQLDGSFLGELGDPGELTQQKDLFVLHEPTGTTSRFDATTGLLLDVADRNGNRVTLNYAGDRLTTLDHSNGDRFTLEYNAQGRLSTLTDQAGQITTYEYDAVGEHLLRVIGPEGTTEYTYDTTDGSPQEHAILSLTRPDGTHVFYEYDARGRLGRTSRDGGAEPVTIGYGDQGEVFVRNARNEITTLFFDDVGQLLQTRDALDRTARLEYDADHRLDRLTQPLDTISLFDFDASGNLTHRVQPDGSAISVNYDANFSVPLTVRDERFIPLRYQYDAQGNPTSVIHSDGTSEQFAFDDAGNVIRTVNRRGELIRYTYDARGLLLRKDHSDGSFKIFTYDDRGNLLSATDERGTTAMQYNFADRITRITYPNGRFLSYTYDAGGRRVRMENQDGFAVNYQYDAAGRLERLTDATNSLVVAYTYDDVGRLIREVRGNGTATEYSYDAASQLVSLVHRLPDSSVSSRFDYTYDALGRRTSVTTLDGTTTFGYDAIGQLTSVALPDGRVIQYEYDAAGNRQAVIDNGVRTDYTTNELNQYTQIGLRALDYDADGNLIVDGTEATYRYDDENRLLASDDGTTNVQYEYDALGMRIARVENGTRTEYLVDPTGLTNIAAEYDASGNVVAHYVHGSFGLVSRFDAGNAIAFYDFDAVGSTVAMTDADGGVANQYDYLPFGETLSIRESIVNPFKFIGQFGVQRDGNGLDFMRTRYYSPHDGRFINEDPLGVGGGTNLYRYAANNPAFLRDPAGLAPPLTPAEVAQFDAILAEAQAIARSNITQVVDMAKIHPAIARAQEITQIVRRPEVILGTSAAARSGALNLVARGAIFVVTRIPAVTLGLTIAGVVTAGIALVSPDTFTYFGGLVCDLSDCDEPDFDVPAPPGDREDAGSTRQVRSLDPNEIVGPAGFGDEQFVSEDTPFVYTVHFENLAAATAPAQTVTVTHQLDPDLDFTTFELMSFGIDDRIVNIPSGRSALDTRFDLRPEKNLLLDVTTELNVETGLVTWNFSSRDPATLDLPEDPLAGFLPPNETSPEGEGFVRYLVRPKTSLATGTRIDAMATVLFDLSPLDTPPILHTIDAGLPTSSVDPLPAIISTPDFEVTWSGSDDANGSGIASFDVFVSDNGGPFTVWQQGTSATSATFAGQRQHTYAFYTTAVDHVGHREAVPLTADTQTQVIDNRAPVAIDDPVSATENLVTIVDPLSNDTDLDGDPLSVRVVDGPSHGILTPNTDGTFTYLPDLNFNREDMFRYVADDGTVDSNIATVMITVGTSFPWHNGSTPLDVNDDGYRAITPNDALLIINELNLNGSYRLPTERPRPLTKPFLDVTRDGKVSPLDALLVINYLNLEDDERVQVVTSDTAFAATLVNNSRMDTPDASPTAERVTARRPIDPEALWRGNLPYPESGRGTPPVQNQNTRAAVLRPRGPQITELSDDTDPRRAGELEAIIELLALERRASSARVS
ncbi:MAG: RHS repeat-associated core domain-containing protein [Pirellulaceae bacterium]